MTKTAWLVAGAFAALGIAAVGCGSSDSETTAAASTATSSSTGSAGGGGSTGSSTSNGGSGGGGPAQTCASYCTSIQANCVDANAQFGTVDNCMDTCKTWDAGTAADMAGNTLGCHIYHAGAAGSGPNVHCIHAGPAGGESADMALCGAPCDNFCEEAMKVCPGVYASESACKTACDAFPAATKNYSSNETSGDTFECREYHLTVASTDPTTHCPHIGATSAACNNM